MRDFCSRLICDQRSGSTATAIASSTGHNEGVGFAPEQKQKLFARFQRLHHPEHKGVSGSGLGLYISRQIVLRHGGEITADSEPGKWAEFRFRIPLRQDAPLVNAPA